MMWFAWAKSLGRMGGASAMPILKCRRGRMGVALEIGQAEMLGFVPHPNLRHCDVFGFGANTFTLSRAMPILRASAATSFWTAPAMPSPEA